jgi:hypothetical protein
MEAEAKEPQKWLDDATLAECRKKFPGEDIIQVRTGGVAFAVRTPDAVLWRQARTLAIDENAEMRVDADSLLVTNCVVHPDPSTLTSLLNRRPALIQKIAKQLSALAGAEEAVEVKKS